MRTRGFRFDVVTLIKPHTLPRPDLEAARPRIMSYQRTTRDRRCEAKLQGHTINAPEQSDGLMARARGSLVESCHFPD